jgi:hypothetical protein
MMRRYDALRPHRDALRTLRRAGTRDPLLALALGPALAALDERDAGGGLPFQRGTSGCTAAKWAVGDPLCGSRVFDRDETVDLSKTMAALDSRLKMAEDGLNSLKNMRFPVKKK